MNSKIFSSSPLNKIFILIVIIGIMDIINENKNSYLELFLTILNPSLKLKKNIIENNIMKSFVFNDSIIPNKTEWQLFFLDLKFFKMFFKPKYIV